VVTVAGSSLPVSTPFAPLGSSTSHRLAANSAVHTTSRLRIVYASDLVVAFWIICCRWSLGSSGSSMIRACWSGWFRFQTSIIFCMLPDRSLPVASVIGPRPVSAAAPGSSPDGPPSPPHAVSESVSARPVSVPARGVRRMVPPRGGGRRSTPDLLAVSRDGSNGLQAGKSLAETFCRIVAVL
jgi:hypothetical protein